MTDIYELIERWNSDEGKPYKGSLIDMGNYKPGNLGCMCAQGQVLHKIGGWTPERLNNVKQAVADAETAKLLNISRAHAILLRNTNDKIDGAPAIVLTDPGKVIGDQWSKLLDFWWYMDAMTETDWHKVDVAWVAIGDDTRASSRTAARGAAWVAAGDDARVAAIDATGGYAWFASTTGARAPAWVAAWEIQGSEILKREGRAFIFLPMFGFNTPDDIPARPDNYGVVK